MNKILVTGAGGFIGSAIAKRMLEMGSEVVTIDNFSTGFPDNVPQGCKLYEGDCYDENLLDRVFAENEFVGIVHIAGQSSGEKSFENPLYDLNTNTSSTLLLLEKAKKHQIVNFVYASSMSVYGDQKEELVSESTPPSPKSFYAVGKLASENYMRIFSSTFGIKCTALRFFNVYGVGQNMANLKQGMASIYLAMAIKDHHIVVKGEKSRFRDFVYIDDVVDAVLRAYDRKTGKMFEIYNVCNQEKHTVESIIDLIEKSLPFTVSHEYIEGTPGDQHGIFGVNTKIKELGWKPRYNFEFGMKAMIEWAINSIKE